MTGETAGCWNFPENNSGQARGIADAGMATFQGNRIGALAREICQNSLDALKDGEDGVTVTFAWRSVPKKRMPGYAAVKRALEDAKAFWDTQTSPDTQNFLKEAVRKINDPLDMMVLRMSDDHTTGLSYPYEPNRLDGWNALTRLDGGATKAGDSAGSFGIGKNAPFVSSWCRLVFYRTLNEQGERAAQGMMRLVSFPKQGDADHLTTGIGYYGNPQRNLPVPEIPELEALNRREGTGTDVFVYGFQSPKDVDTEMGSWDEDIKLELLSNFIYAIYRNRLTVVFENNAGTREILERSSIGRYVEKFYARSKKAKVKNLYNTYLLLRYSERVNSFSTPFHGLGTLNLRCLNQEGEPSLNRQVLVVRKSGMTLYYMKSISKTINFTGILELQGEKLNAFFRAMENTDHTKWEAKRHPSPSRAKLYLKEMRDWVQDSVISLVDKQVVDEEVEVKGLSSMLQEGAMELPPTIALVESQEQPKETIQPAHSEFETAQQPAPEPSRGILHRNQPAEQGKETGQTKKTKGTITERGIHSVMRLLKGTRKRKKKTMHKGEEDPQGKDLLLKPERGKWQDVPLQSLRILKLSGNHYRLLFEVPVPVRKGRLEIVTVGENGKSVLLRAGKIQSWTNLEVAEVIDGSIHFCNLQPGNRVKLEFSLLAEKEYAMEVHAYEDN